MEESRTGWSGRPCYGALAGIARARDGFTLVELLVAIAIFVTVMASVALAFNTAIRTSKQGFQNQEAYELARGTMKVLERDLSRAFTNRDHGDNFSFYGTPIGFTYVGLISADESSDANMARVTYVVYHGPLLVNDRANDSRSVVFPPYTAKDGATVPTYSLLRFIEPGRDTLDSYPIKWTELANPSDTGDTFSLGGVVEATVQAQGCPDAACSDLVRRSARREIWIKMLAGGGDAVEALGANGSLTAGVLPNAWSDPARYMGLTAITTPPVNDAAIADLVSQYAVAENIRYLNVQSTNPGTGQPYCAVSQAQLQSDLTALNLSIDFDDAIYTASNGNTCVRFLSSYVGSAPMFDATDRWRAVYSPADGPRPFFTYWDLGTITASADPTLIGKNTPVALQFWNDWRNVRANPGPDGIFGTADDPAAPVFSENVGSPLDTRLPIAVTTDFTVFFQSPYVGAPDFNERFTQRIDLPVGYRRTYRAPAAAP